MQCANPHCRMPALDLSAGVLRLVELDVPPEERVLRSDGGFPVCSVPSRYFWLCPRCSSYLRVGRWTFDGVILELTTGDRALHSNDTIIPFTDQRARTLTKATRKTA